jgi:hypothetical protein
VCIRGGWRMRIVAMNVSAVAMAVVGCSVYPIPDDVSFLRTENIVRFSRCEMRNSILNHMVERNYIFNSSDENEIKAKVDYVLNIKDKSKLSDRDKDLLRLTKVAAVYTFDFDVVEKNNVSAGAVFKLPWLTESLDAGVGGGIDLTRHGSRVFGAEDKWADVIKDKEICKNSHQPSANIIYPITGSIGIGNVVKTFIDIDEQGGAKDNFVDELTFTTAISGDASAGLKLDLAPKRIRPTSISGSYGASRADTHKLKLSLAFPQQDVIPAITGVRRSAGDLNAPFTRPADWRARYNLCVADARARENTFKALRFEAPEVYCVRYADAFAPQYGFDTRPRTMTRPLRPAAPAGEIGPTIMPRTQSIPRQTAPRPKTAPLPTVPQYIRPNAEL